MTTPPLPPLPGTDGPSQERPRPGGARVWLAGLGVSALLHLGFLFLYPILMARITPDPAGAVRPGSTVEPGGIEVLRLSELPEPASEPPDLPVEPEEEPDPQPRDPTPAPEPASEASGERPTAAERLRVPESGDRRIWRPVDPSLTELTDEERARLRILARLEALNDSALSEAERLRRAREWVYTDEEGKKWGISPGQLHLGGVTIPMPSFSAPPSARDALEEWRWDDVERGASTSIIRDTWEERIEAIRERRDAERADTSGAPP